MPSHPPSDTDDSTEPISDEHTEPRPLANLTGFKRDQLFVIRMLAERNPHGLVIKDKLDCYYDEEINQGRLYQNLSELVEEGYVEKRPLDGRTNAYRPSTRANRRLEEHHEWERRCLCCESP
ncbi:helix-turn-helix transcriptional regulator [Haloterrigena sp. SYSU A558-1]|uniref:Helix-turn-helix transcriptional regulator n=1 Tax=Haloterrigena gelatinilytica TaxID=2741724 RepID=A0A8J8GKA4_9EURY|nr:helix-turn-helix transcriptional regulator [Haloterrigena gelatinilytica]NUB91568.1 helix-turn-helix transcriptional regulator [Haloterrigena gelatinilytica]NUC72695.1 helix-turn-helix transcriptional regulator [Haloterrigena gelatinilytica]